MIDSFTVLAEDEDLPRWDVPEQLATLYGGAIGLDEPCVVANFVESLDGVVAVPRLPRSHAIIGDESEADRFVLALVRACADAVVVGSGTLLASPKGTWRIDRAYPPAAEALAELRACAAARSSRSSWSSPPAPRSIRRTRCSNPARSCSRRRRPQPGLRASVPGRPRSSRERRRDASTSRARWTCCATAAAR